MVKTIQLFLEEVFIVAGVAIERIFRRAWYGFTMKASLATEKNVKTLLLIFTLGFLCRVLPAAELFVLFLA